MIKNNLLLIMMLGILFLVSVSCKEDNELTQTVKSKNDYTGEQLFKSTMFGVGDFSAQVSTLKDLNQKHSTLPIEKQSEIESKLEELIAAIKADNPTFFEEYKSNLTSGDHFKIQEAIKASSFAIADRLEILVPGFSRLQPIIENDFNTGALTTNDDLDEKKINKRVQEYKRILSDNFISSENGTDAIPCTWAVVCVAYFAVAVHNTAAVSGNLAVALAVWKWIGVVNASEKGANQQSSLQLEILVNELAQAH